MSPLTPDLKMYPYLVMFDDGLHFNITSFPIYAVDREAAIALAATAVTEVSRGVPVWAYPGTNVEAAIEEFRKTLE